ncbi:hypothetical protein [Rhodococcus sp. USK13]|uniref:hypothetical protein n=1 Tax=Rhodococcus sp. USK13 TaxID=2806442 RepID=UPI001BCC68DF|nr:hypothetical protein [Rhodococcus sp. USK13]
MSEERGQWLTAQISVSAHRLMNTSPALLSPAGRSLRETAAAWVAQEQQVTVTQHATPALRVVATEAKDKNVDLQTQLPLLGTLSDH